MVVTGSVVQVRAPQGSAFDGYFGIVEVVVDRTAILHLYGDDSVKWDAGLPFGLGELIPAACQFRVGEDGAYQRCGDDAVGLYEYVDGGYAPLCEAHKEFGETVGAAL